MLESDLDLSPASTTYDLCDLRKGPDFPKTLLSTVLNEEYSTHSAGPLGELGGVIYVEVLSA